MHAVLLTGHGGPEVLEYREDVPVPAVGRDEVLVRVAAAGINNTDINSRIGWYSKSVRLPTGETAAKAGAALGIDPSTASWAGSALQFPRIQGADGCGWIVAVGADVAAARIGERVLVRAVQRDPADDRPFRCRTLGSECDGAFAQYLSVPAADCFAVRCDWSAAELASVPCAYSTAENMLHRADAARGERLLITGASGGVGSAAVQLAKRRGAEVVAVASADKAEAVRALGADRVLPRDADFLSALGGESLDLVVDLVGGAQWPHWLALLRRGGRYVVSGAIAGPIVELDLRTLYLKDLRLIGATCQDSEIFPRLIGYIERGEIRPVVAKTYPLSEIAAAQDDFLAKRFVGKLVLVPPQA